MLLAASVCQQAATMSAYKFTCMLLPPPMHYRNLWCTKERTLGGANWDPQAKKLHIGVLQQPACNHKEHQILSTTEATGFANQFWDR